MNNNTENILKFNEKPYYTDEELKIYYQVAIDEFMKSGNIAMANRYKLLLSLIDESEAEKEKNRNFFRNNKR